MPKNEDNSIKFVPGVIIVTEKEWKKMPTINYVILERENDKLRLGCYLPEYQFLNKTVLKPTPEEEKLIQQEL